MKTKSYHSICAWSFHSGKGGFVPSNIRPKWSKEKLDTVGKIRLIKEKIAPRIPKNVVLGFEMHYDYEFNELNSSEIADALIESGIYLAMTTPGAHAHFAYGGVASPDPHERKKAEEFAEKTVELTYNPLKKAWHPDSELVPTLVIWNGSFGYDIATIGISRMYQNLKESIAKLCRFEEKLGGELYIGFEPKPNEGHPAMLIPTVASAILFWRRLEEEFGISRTKKGINKEFGHSEMIGLDYVYDTVEELDNSMMVHLHINSQGLSDGITLGGPGKFDIDYGVHITGTNIAVAELMREAGYSRWKGHDMQPRPYDSCDDAIERIVRSILSWEACEIASGEIDYKEMLNCLAERKTAKAEDIIHHAVVRANELFDEMK